MDIEEARTELECASSSDPFNLSTDPYLARGPTGTFHCKKCLTTHPTEANYLIHREGRRHKAAIDRSRKYQELATAQKSGSLAKRPHTESHESHDLDGLLDIKAPSYEVVKVNDPSIDGWTIRVILSYANSENRPVYRLISMHEQKVEKNKDLRYMFLVVGCVSFRNVALKIPNSPRINRNTIHTTWEDGKFSLLFSYHTNDQHLAILTQ
ncbi:hypothetical protein XU18_3003 [Perkinsela sp. CCAP 1560/4]|nr:hypothetical protein XU18_3003 [Perkinsela sp. CCAP 1560/4]|eukprot:KNH06066.1 hypothetical protein XU18_3003 [Perkinsela sp. CCAP 1560/4]